LRLKNDTTKVALSGYLLSECVVGSLFVKRVQVETECSAQWQSVRLPQTTLQIHEQENMTLIK
jgi:hypothetical protein